MAGVGGQRLVARLAGLVLIRWEPEQLFKAAVKIPVKVNQGRLVGLLHAVVLTDTMETPEAAGRRLLAVQLGIMGPLGLQTTAVMVEHMVVVVALVMVPVAEMAHLVVFDLLGVQAEHILATHLMFEVKHETFHQS